MIEQLRKDKKLLCDKIREYSASQANFWRRVPWLALEADGRGGYLDKYARAYTDGMWAIGSAQDAGHYTVFIDLENGNLVDAWKASQRELQIIPAYDKDLVRIDFSELDAKATVEGLIVEANKPHYKTYDPKEQEKWREAIRNEYKVERIYSRLVPAKQ